MPPEQPAVSLFPHPSWTCGGGIVRSPRQPGLFVVDGLRGRWGLVAVVEGNVWHTVVLGAVLSHCDLIQWIHIEMLLFRYPWHMGFVIAHSQIEGHFGISVFHRSLKQINRMLCCQYVAQISFLADAPVDGNIVNLPIGTWTRQAINSLGPTRVSIRQTFV